jgi:SAM-dependent methyltransferase
LGLRVLEAGCGSGKFGLWYAWRSAMVTLLDIDPGVLVYTRALRDLVEKTLQLDPGIYKLNWVKVVQGSIFDLASLYPDAPYDFVFNEGVAHHFPRSDPRRQESLNQMVKVTRPGGTVAVMVSNAHCPGMMDYATQTEHTYAGMPPKQEPFGEAELFIALLDAGLTALTVKVKPVEEPHLAHARTLVGWGRTYG